MAPPDSDKPSNDEAPATEPEKPGRVAALKRLITGSRRRKITSVALAVCLVAGSIGGYMAFSGGENAEEEISIEAAFDAFDAEEYLQSQIIALQIRSLNPEDPKSRSASAFITGAISVHETDHRWEKDKSASYLLAARQLEEAQELGFPEGREGQGLLLLGRCLYEGRQFAQCMEPLMAALKELPDESAKIHALLTRAHLLLTVPNPEQALHHNTAYLAHTTLTPDERNSALLQHAEILLRLERSDEATQWLAKIPNSSPQHAEALVIQGRRLVGIDRAKKVQADETTSDAAPVALSQARKQELDDAIRLFREALTLGTPNSDSTRKATYLIGIALAEKRKWSAALEQFQRTRRLFYDSPEGQTAGLYAADVLRQQGKHDEAIAMYLRAFDSAGTPRSYSNPWLPLDGFRKRMVTAYRFYLDEGEFERALALLDGFRPLFTRMHTIELQAQAQLAWADALLKQSQMASISARRGLRREGYEHFRLAGYTFAKLARMRKATSSYPDDLWESAVALAEGQDHPNAIRMFEEYIHAQPHRRQAEALVWLGKSQMISGKLDEAIHSFQECLEFHERDAAVFDARLWCARAHLEKGETDEAEKLLSANLVGEGLTPASREWRESLFLLGQVLHESGHHEEAIVKLEESVARSPDSSESLLGMYLIAQAYNEAAKEPAEKLQQASIESIRLANAKQLRLMLEGALRYYTRLQKRLLQKEEGTALVAMEVAMLRNCYFAIGAVLFKMERFDEAIEAFSDATTRFQNEPLVLEAFVQIANSHRRMGRHIEARGALAQARVVLKRLDPESGFTETTNYNFEEWGRVIDQMAQW